MERAVLHRDEAVAVGAEGIGVVGVDAPAADGQPPAVGLALQPGEGVAGDVAGGELPALLGQPQGVGTLTGPHVQGPTGSQTAGLPDQGEPSPGRPEQRVHPGHDWFVVLEGRVRLWLGDREIDVETGEAAEFATMTPHSFSAPDGPAELVMVFDRGGQLAHARH